MNNSFALKNYLNRLLIVLNRIDNYITTNYVTDNEIICTTKEAFQKWDAAIISKSIIDYIDAIIYCSLAISTFYNKYKYEDTDKEAFNLLNELKIVVTSYVLFERSYAVYKNSNDKNSPEMIELFKSIANYFQTIDIEPLNTINPTLN